MYSVLSDRISFKKESAGSGGDDEIPGIWLDLIPFDITSEIMVVLTLAEYRTQRFALLFRPHLKNNMKNFCLGITIAVIAALSGCSDQENHENISGIQEIKYGTSFGECLGYCRKSISITPSEIEFTKKGWDLDGQLPDSTLRESLPGNAWDNLVEGIDMDAYLALDSVIGCPDCADGGAEWIEIVAEEQTYKVTFEYMNTPAVMATYIDTLRNYMDGFDPS